LFFDVFHSRNRLHRTWHSFEQDTDIVWLCKSSRTLD
jgi:hypothetical protein